jgi:hypothetical protein
VGPIIYDGKYLFNKNKFYFKNIRFYNNKYVTIINFIVINMATHLRRRGDHSVISIKTKSLIFNALDLVTIYNVEVMFYFNQIFSADLAL